MSNKSISLDNLKLFFRDILPKYITNKDILDKISYNDNVVYFNGKALINLNDTNKSATSTYSSEKIEEELMNSLNKLSPDFCSESGFGGLRYYNNQLWYYDTGNSQWVKCMVSNTNGYIINTTPKDCSGIKIMLNKETKKIKLKFIPPTNTILNDEIMCLVSGVAIMRKAGSAPIGPTDPEAELVMRIESNDFNKYSDIWFEDPLGNYVEDTTYYYHFYPYSDNNNYNLSDSNLIHCTYRITYNLFEFTLNQAESDPSKMITYGADNAGFVPAHMNYDTDKFDYGDWTVENGAWFMDVKPCMLKYDGTVDYYLDPNDYSKKITGEVSDYNNLDYEGNVMIQIPKVYIKEILYEDNADKVTYQISDKKVDDDFKCWAHLDNNGNEIDYCYMAAYEAYNKNNKLRSISGVKPTGNLTAATGIAYAKANNTTDNIIWYTGVLCDRMLIDKLLLLIGKSTDTQTIFGAGNISNGSSTSDASTTGNLNDKGLFYGTKTNNKKGVKIFGIEQYWGSLWNRIAGCLYFNSSGYNIKLTYGQSDGSTVDGYNLDGSGYINTGINCSGSSGAYIKHSVFANQCILPNVAGASNSTYYCDGLDYHNGGYLRVGGYCSNGLLCGMLYWNVSYDASYSDWIIGSSLSCKPLASIE